jgi:hypothetical protein
MVFWKFEPGIQLSVFIHPNPHNLYEKSKIHVRKSKKLRIL